MKKYLFGAVLAAIIVGCGDYSSVGDTVGDYVSNDYSGQDNSVNYEAGTVLVCTDANCSVAGTPEADAAIQNDKEVTIGTYPGADADPATCNDAGFFWCSIEKKCLPQRLDSGSCN